MSAPKNDSPQKASWNGRFLYLPDGTLHRIQANGVGPVVQSPRTFAIEQDRSATVAIETDFEPFADGTVLELVRDPENDTHLQLLVWEDGIATVRNRVDHGGRSFIPPQVHPSLVKSIRFPTGVQACGPPRVLYRELSRELAHYSGLGPEARFLVGSFAVRTWFVDFHSVAPSLDIVGPPDSAKMNVLRYLHCVCRRPLLLGDITPTSLCQLADTLSPTLLIGEIELMSGQRGGEMQRLFRAGSTHGMYAIRGVQAFNLYGPKVFCSRQRLSDPVLASRTIHIPLSPDAREVIPLDDAAMERIAKKFQPKLLQYFLENRARVRAHQPLEVPQFTASLREQARTLAAPMLGDQALEKRLVWVLAQHDEEAKMDRQLEPEWLVVEALFRWCHDRSSWGIYVGELTAKVNELIELHGAGPFLKARGMGVILDQLRLKREKRDHVGYMITKKPAVERRVHELAHQYGFTRADILDEMTAEGGYEDWRCPSCREFGLYGTDKGRTLPSVKLSR